MFPVTPNLPLALPSPAGGTTSFHWLVAKVASRYPPRNPVVEIPQGFTDVVGHHPRLRSEELDVLHHFHVETPQYMFLSPLPNQDPQEPRPGLSHLLEVSY